MANFNKNPLQDGVVRQLNEYSNDLETRTYDAFQEIPDVADYIVDFGNNWEKWKSGKLVQRGYESLQGHNEGNAKNILYPIPFANNQADVIVQLVRNADTLNVSPSVVVNKTGSTSTYFRVYHTSTNAISIFLTWEATGRWK